MGLTENPAPALLALNGLDVLPNSAVSVEDTGVGLAGSGQKVVVLAPPGSRVLSGFAGESSAAGGRTLALGPMNAGNLDALRGLLPWLRPRPLGTHTSAGFGDRLGLATPGHVRALRAAGGELAPIFAQQSIREMERTGRSPEDVLADATWGVFAEGWQGGFGAGADHLKTAGDIDACAAAGFERDIEVHAAFARTVSPDGPYKLSLHSGSDKYFVYPAFVSQTRGLAHLKTAGTSYLEALRTVATLDPELFRKVYDLSRTRYEEDRASYHVSASLERAVQPEDVPDEELPALLEQFDAREILHVTFGSVLKAARFRDRLMGLLCGHPDHYASGLEKHFLRHLEPFAIGGKL